MVQKSDRKPRRPKKQRPVRYLFPVEEAERGFDPLLRDKKRNHRIYVGFIYAFLAAAFHVILAAVLMRAGGNSLVERKPAAPKNVLVSIQEPAISETAQEEPAPGPEPAPVETVKPLPLKNAPKVLQKAAPKTAREMPVDPVDIPATPQDAPPPRKVVGISFESTVSGGNGPALAVGNTRMGETGKRAEDASKVTPASGARYRGPGTAPVNQVAAAIPTDNLSLVKPKRLSSLSPEYPALLKAQGIEGDVAVLIRISPDGKVLDAKVIKGSGQSDFDKAALTAAQKERFSPAIRNGEPIEYTLKYTYRFRVTG
jgi:protein TonB